MASVGITPLDSVASASPHMMGNCLPMHRRRGAQFATSTPTVVVVERTEPLIRSQIPDSEMQVATAIQQEFGTHDAWQAAGKHQINIDLSDATGQKSWCALWGFRSVILPERRPPLLVVKEARAVSLAKRLGGAGDGSAS